MGILKKIIGRIRKLEVDMTIFTIKLVNKEKCLFNKKTNTLTFSPGMLTVGDCR